MSTVLAEKILKPPLRENVKEELQELNVCVVLDLFNLEPEASHDQELNLDLKLDQLEDY